MGEGGCKGPWSGRVAPWDCGRHRAAGHPARRGRGGGRPTGWNRWRCHKSRSPRWPGRGRPSTPAPPARTTVRSSVALHAAALAVAGACGCTGALRLAICLAHGSVQMAPAAARASMTQCGERWRQGKPAPARRTRGGSRPEGACRSPASLPSCCRPRSRTLLGCHVPRRVMGRPQPFQRRRIGAL